MPTMPVTPQQQVPQRAQHTCLQQLLLLLGCEMHLLQGGNGSCHGSMSMQQAHDWQRRVKKPCKFTACNPTLICEHGICQRAMPTSLGPNSHAGGLAGGGARLPSKGRCPQAIGEGLL